MKLTRVLVALALFGVGFGYVEAAVVVYLRTIGRPIRREALGLQPADEVFPLVTWERLRQTSRGQEYARSLRTEVGRELATLVVLAGVALAVARNRRQWLAAFMIAFGIWDVFYYAFLRLLIGWPESLWTWDVLFLLPVVWTGPVLSPLVVAASMIAAGLAILWRESQGRPIRFGWPDVLAIGAGAMILVVTFCWDFRNTSTGGWPNPFNWPLFVLGEALGVIGFAHAALASRGPPGDRV